MQIMYFTERPYKDVPEDEVLRNRSFFGVSNSFYDPKVGARLYNEYIDHAIYAEEMGFDAIMLNEHHGTPYCMGAVMNVEAAILARVTRKVRIVLLGNPLPVVKHPPRLAEELAEIDLISHGRLIPGWVRGAGSEQIFNNANPAYNREYFNEAHDLVIACWTRPGPFRWEGRHFNYRFVNPWVLPYQKPHPPIWIPGLVSPETVAWCAQHRYPYIGLGTALPATVELWNLYADIAAKEGYLAGSENVGYLQHCFVAETEEKAQEVGRMHLFGGGGANFSRPEWTLPPGYNSKAANRRLAQTATDYGFLGLTSEKLEGAQKGPGDGKSPGGQRGRPSPFETDIAGARAKLDAEYRKAQASLSIITGTPKTVIPKLRRIMEVLRPGVFAIFNTTGPVESKDTMNSIRLMGAEVLPAMREYAKELGIVDPFERTPGSRPYVAGTKRDPLVDVAALQRAPAEVQGRTTRA